MELQVESAMTRLACEDFERGSKSKLWRPSGYEPNEGLARLRLALKAGTSAIISRLSRILKEGVADGSIVISGSPGATAQTLYQLWMGASVIAKISHDRAAFANANAATERILAGEAF